MSLILDALKKLEQDRISRRKRATRIASDILTAREPRIRRAWLWAAGLIGAALAAAALTIAFLVPFSPQARKPEPDRPITAPADPAPVSATQSLSEDSVRAIKKAQKEPDKQALRSALPLERKMSPPSVSDEPAREDPGSLPFLTVSGILWAESRGSRRAMINDSVVGEGGSIEGAKVIEIQQDHVRFSLSGQIFDVYMR